MNLIQQKIIDRYYFLREYEFKTYFFRNVGSYFGICEKFLIIIGSNKLDKTCTSLNYIIGIIIYFVGFVIILIEKVNFEKNPVNKPLSTGLYNYSRNPEIIGIQLTFLGMNTIVGNWINFIFQIITIYCNHYFIIGKEKWFEKLFGKEYLEIKRKVPRYLMFL